MKSEMESKFPTTESLMMKYPLGKQKYLKSYENLFCANLEKHIVLMELAKIPVPKGICGKRLDNDYGWFCKECSLLDNCVMCCECFERSDHKEHHVYLGRNTDGSCDCGDLEAFRKEGCCPEHQGQFIKNCEIFEWLPIPFRTSIPQAIDFIAMRIFSTLLCNSQFEEMGSEFESEAPSSINNAYENELKNLINILNETTNINVIVMSEVARALCTKRTNYYRLVDGKNKKISLEKPLSAIDALVLSHSYWENSERKSLSKLILQCISNHDFRQQLCLAYFTNLYHIITHLQSGGGKLSKMCVHLVCNDDIMLEMIKNNSNVLEDFLQLITNFFHDTELDNDSETPSEKLEILQNNFSLLMSTKTTLYVLKHTTVII